MKKLYQKPEMSIVKMIELEAVDIIRTSGELADKPKDVTEVNKDVQKFSQLPDSAMSVFN